MSDEQINPTAFPHDRYIGMTLRDYFAGQALMGFCVNISEIPYGDIVRWDRISQEAYEIADFMLKERVK